MYMSLSLSNTHTISVLNTKHISRLPVSLVGARPGNCTHLPVARRYGGGPLACLTFTAPHIRTCLKSTPGLTYVDSGVDLSLHGPCQSRDAMEVEPTS